VTKWRSKYWQAYNIMVRVLGLVILTSGALATLVGLLGIMQLGLFQTEGSPEWVTLFLGITLMALGSAIVVVPAFRPDLGDTWMEYDRTGEHSQELLSSKRSWWMGDRVKGRRSGDRAKKRSA
jgi:hypothetical protein